jgi:hypothetical protein
VKQFDPRQLSSSSQHRSEPNKRAFGTVLWSLFVVAATIFGVLSGPKVVTDSHELMCASSSWRPLARRFGDCAAPAKSESDRTESLARQRIVDSGYTPDNAGFIRAIANRNDISDEYKALNIKGDENSLRTALLNYRVNTTEFAILMGFMKNSSLDHYSRDIVEEIRVPFRKMSTSNSFQPILDLACARDRPSFVSKLFKKNFSAFCENDAEWKQKAFELASYMTPVIDGATAQWWQSKAFVMSRYRETSGQIIQVGTVIDAIGGYQELNGEYVVQRANITLLLGGDDNKFLVGIYSQSDAKLAAIANYSNSSGQAGFNGCYALVLGAGTTLTMTDVRNFIRHPYYDGRLKTPKCSARLVVAAQPKQAVRVISIEEVQQK